MALPEETPRILHAGNGTRGPFPLAVDGTPISYADGSQIVVTRYDADGVGTLQVEGTHYELSAETALPDMSDAERPIAVASFTFKLAQPVLAAGQNVLAERVSVVEQALVLNIGGGFSAPANERNLDAVIRISQELSNKLARVVTINALDDDGPIDMPVAADRASKWATWDADGNLAAASASPGSGDLLSTNNLSDLTSAASARTNLGLGSAALLASSAVFQVANNLSEGNAVTMRSNLGLGSAALLASSAVAQVAAANVFTNALNTYRGRVAIDPGYAVYAASFACCLDFSRGALISVPASNQFDVMHQNDTITVGANGLWHFSNHNIDTDTATDATANIRGDVSNLRAGGLGTYTNEYMRAELLTAGYAADLFNIKAAIKTRSGVGNVYNRQVANDTDLGGQIDAIEWVTSQTATAAITDYTYLSDNKNSVVVAHMQYSAVGNGDFLTEKNSLSTVDLFRVDKLGVAFVASLELGNIDTSFARSSAGNASIEGNVIYRQGGIDVAVTDGGTGDSTARGACGNLGTWHVLAASAVAVSRNSANTVADVTPQTLATVTIPANALGANGIVRIISTWSYTNSVNVKHPRITYGGTDYLENTPTTTQWWRAFCQWMNVNSTASQKGNGQQVQGGWGATATASNGQKTSSVDTTASSNITFTAAWDAAASGETITLESYVVEIFKQA